MKQKDDGVYALAFAAVILAAIFIWGCGPSGQIEPTLAPRAVREAEQCARNNTSCFMVHVTNDQYYRMVVKLNGVKIGEVEGHSHGSFAVAESRLKNGRCASVQVYLIGPAVRGSSDSQCIRYGGYFSLQV